MNTRHIFRWSLVAALAAVATSWGLSQSPAAQGPADAEEVEILTRGPVHEAFAATVTFDPEPGFIAPRTPPDLIEELPPEQQPEGDNVEWIPGYWAWDDEREDFLWISGLWRALPPGREWVPGYWGESGPGAQWTSGYWADAEATEQEYLPEPPATAEVGPNIAQPSSDHNWIPGLWMWHQNRYAWRPGYWVVGQQDWDWIPSHYQWTPRGYVYIDGYYDYSVDRRGVLFSPVHFSPSVYGRRGFSYSPVVTINLAAFTNHLFLRPTYQHYYFGDYYESRYTDGGFHPWFTYGSRGRGYDPFFARQQWRNRDDRNWMQRVETEFNNRRDHEDARPPRTWRDQQELIRSGRSQDRDRVIVRPFDEEVKSEEGRYRYLRVDQEQRQRLSQRGQEFQRFRAERQKLEADTADAADAATEERVRDRQPARVRRPKSPIVARYADQADKDHALPGKPDAPPPDLNVEPKPRPTGRRPGASEGAPRGPGRKPPETSQDEPAERPKAQPGSKTRSEDEARKRPAPPAPEPGAKAKERGKPRGKTPNASNDEPGKPAKAPAAKTRPEVEARKRPTPPAPDPGAKAKERGKPSGKAPDASNEEPGKPAEAPVSKTRPEVEVRKRPVVPAPDAGAEAKERGKPSGKAPDASNDGPAKRPQAQPASKTRRAVEARKRPAPPAPDAGAQAQERRKPSGKAPGAPGRKRPDASQDRPERPAQDDPKKKSDK